MEYGIIFLALFILEIIYFRIADRFNIIDKPNARSSHTAITLRGGGIIFPIAMLIAFATGKVSWAFTLAVVLVAVVSFIDDIKPLHQLPRFSSHLIAVALVLYDLQLFDLNVLWIALIFILAIGWINAFNFMDGINGITVLYALVTIVTFMYIYRDDSVFGLLAVMATACLVFGFFNVRKKAKTFAGDVGSISMAVFLAYFVIRTVYETGQAGYVLFLSVYGLDAIITIIYRLKNKENIFEPHRSHLYQYLANEMKWPHIKVSALYAFVQLAINVLVLYLMQSGFTSVLTFIALGVVLLILYWIIRIKVKKRIDVQYA